MILDGNHDPVLRKGHFSLCVSQDTRTLCVSHRTPFRNVQKSFLYLSSILALRRLRQGDREFQARLDHIGRSVSKRKQGRGTARSVLLWCATGCGAVVSLESKARH